MTRLLIFSLNYYPFVGGAEVAIKEITDRLSKDAYECHVIVYRFNSALPRREQLGAVTIHRVGFGKRNISFAQTYKPLAYLGKILYVPFATLKALSLHRKERFDLGWAMMVYMLFPLALMRLAGVRLPYVLTLQEGDPFDRVFERPHIRIVMPLLRYGLRHASAVQTISTFLLGWVRRLGFTGDGRVVPNGVDTRLFGKPYAPEEIGAYKEMLGKESDDIYLVTTSRLVTKNAVDDVIRALPLLPPHISFIVYGSGPEHSALRALAEELRVSERVRFMGQAEHASMPALLRACDIFVRPSRTEGMGNSFVEAMAAGLPVIATQEGGIADFLFDAKRNPDRPTTGWAVDRDSPKQIAEAVQAILSDQAEVARVTKHARDLVTEKYDWDTVADQMNGLFANVMRA